MLATLWQFAINTPWWVYLIFFVVLRVGILATKPHVVLLQKLFILPVIFTAMTIHTLITRVSLNFFTIGTLIIMMLIGVVAGWWQLHQLKLQVDRKKWLIHMPGNWSTLIIILVIFVSKYYFSYQLDVYPEKVNQLAFVISFLGVMGVCTGLFVGRLLYCIYRFKIA